MTAESLQSEHAAEQDIQDSLVDKLKGGDYGELVKTAEKSQQAQMDMQAELCLRADGSVVKADPYKHKFDVVKVGADTKPPVEDPQEELKRLRAQRMAQMKDEGFYRSQGHGELKVLANEIEFAAIVAPHERGVMLLDDGESASEDLAKAMARLAKTHLETLFCRLPADRAQVILRAVELEGLPAIFTLNNGAITRQLTPAMLFKDCSQSSPLLAKNLARMLHKAGALTSGDGASGSSGSEDEGTHRGRRR